MRRKGEKGEERGIKKEGEIDEGGKAKIEEDKGKGELTEGKRR